MEVGVAKGGWALGEEAVGNAGDDVAAAGSGVEEAGAVGEVAVGGGQVDEVHAVEIEGADGGDGGGNFLAIGADVLDRGAPDGAGDAGEALEAGAVVGDGALDEGVPVFSGGGLVEAGAGVSREGFDTTEGDAEDEAGEAGVGDEEIAAPAEDEERGGVFAGPADGFDDIFFRGCFCKPPGGATNAEGGERGERDVLHNLHLRVVSH